MMKVGERSVMRKVQLVKDAYQQGRRQGQPVSTTGGLENVAGSCGYGGYPPFYPPYYPPPYYPPYGYYPYDYNNGNGYPYNNYNNGYPYNNNYPYYYNYPYNNTNNNNNGGLFGNLL
jgi:hypothetical protein